MKRLNKRPIEIKVRLTRKEAENLEKSVKKSQLSREAYVRSLMNGLIPQEAPPPDYYSMMRQLYSIGNSLNQIAATAHNQNFIDAPKYDRSVAEYRAAVKTITEAVLLPRRIG
jgi:hypothetical protein